MKVHIVGEDQVTSSVIKRILTHCSDDFEIIQFPESYPRGGGGQIKNNIPKYNRLSETHPVVLLIDLDNNGCAPLLIKKLIKDKNHDFIFNIAVDEAEAWLMADREGFATYFKIKMEDMPSSHQTKQGGRKTVTEMDFDYKSSWFFTHILIQKSENPEFIQQLAPKERASKGPEYNSCVLPFIETAWSVENARQNSDSLSRMISRIKELERRHL